MPTILCPQSTPCVNPANPVTNYSSEKPDKEVFLGFSSGSPLNAPSPGQPFTNPGGYFYCSSLTSQEAADLCGDNGATDNGVDDGGTSNDPPPNTGGDPGGPGQVFWNAEQSASVTCPDGNSFTYTMRSNTVRSTNPILADQIAASIALIRANRYLICISSISGACLGEEYDQLITATTQTSGDIDWQLRSGSLPPGITMLPDLFNTKQISLFGTPTVAGNYVFVIRATDALGNFMEKTFKLAVLGFTNSPSAATVGTPYSFQFTASGGTAPYSFSVPPGNLPAGLVMSDSGLITGTPTEDIPTTFTVTIDDSAGNQCGKQFTMTPKAAGCASQIAGLTWTYDNDPSLIGPGFAMTAGSGTFSAAAPAPFSAFAECFCIIVNNTAAPFTVRFKYVWSCLSTLGEITCYDAETATFIIDQTAPFTGTNQGDLVINPGETHHITLYVQTGSDAPASGTVLITCV